MENITQIVLLFVLRFAVLLPCIIVHEVAHGYVAYLCGDNTAKNAGRLTLNPVKHIDLWGTVIMPLILLVGSGGSFSFGYAKPVPINPRAFKNERSGMALTGIAGPAVNIALAVIAGLSLQLLTPIISPTSTVGFISLFLISYFCQINLVLAFFNLIPIPPLDGSRVVQKFLPDRLRDKYHELERYGFMLLLVILFLVPSISSTLTGTRIDPISWYLNVTVYPILSLLTGA